MLISYRPKLGYSVVVSILHLYYHILIGVYVAFCTFKGTRIWIWFIRYRPELMKVSGC